MLDTLLRIAFPLMTVLFLSGIAVRRMRIRTAIGHDPVRVRPFHDLDSAYGFNEAMLGIAMGLLTLDVFLFAWSPALMEPLAVPALRVLESIRWAGAGALLAGLILIAVCIREMGTSWRMGIDHDRPGVLVRTGLYARLRHPIYVGIQLITWGVGVATGQAVALCVAVAATVGVNIQARLEEAFLLSRHGDEYRHYVESTGRFWPKGN